jgi:shikimate kinase
MSTPGTPAVRPLMVIVGPPASGKTTIGTAASKALGLVFRDTDHDVEAEAGTSVADVFVQLGEPHFREMEERAVARALAEHDGVLALGGGAVTREVTRERLVAYAKDGGTVVWLDVDLHSAAARVGLSRDRPILGVNPRAMLRHMLETRAAMYGEVATITVRTGGRTPEEVLAEVLAALPPSHADR